MEYEMSLPTAIKAPHKARPFKTLGSRSIACYYVTPSVSPVAWVGFHFVTVYGHCYVAGILHYWVRISDCVGNAHEVIARLVPWTMLEYSHRLPAKEQIRTT